MAVDDQYFYDRVFDDVTYYPTTQKSTGWSRCILTCPGNCMEYGPTGNSYCFPHDYVDTPIVFNYNNS